MKTVLVTSFDENYMEYSKVFVKTLSENYHGDERLSLYCLVPKQLLTLESTFISELGDTGNISIEFKHSDRFGSLVGKLRTKDYISINAWHRMFIGSICKDFDRAIYIDSDTIVLRNISPLLNFKADSVFAAYIQDDQSLAKKLFGNYDTTYFNAGVFIANIKYWNSNDIEDKTVNNILSNNVTEYLDQDALNIYFSNVVDPMPVTFNCPHWYQENQMTHVDSPMIVHFIGPNKPWKSYQSSSSVPEVWRRRHLEITGVDLEKQQYFYERLPIHE